MLDITRDKPVKVAVKVAVPVRDHPKVGRVSVNHANGNRLLILLIGRLAGSSISLASCSGRRAIR